MSTANTLTSDTIFVLDRQCPTWAPPARKGLPSSSGTVYNEKDKEFITRHSHLHIYHSHAEAPRTQDQLLQGFTQLLAAVGVDERVDERVTDDEDEEKVKVSKEAVAEGASGTGEDEDEVQEEGAPA